MPGWISEIIVIAPWLGALLAVVFVVWKFGPTVRRLSRALDRVIGVPEDAAAGQKKLPGLFERMDHQDEKLAEQSEVLETIRHEVEFNNGSSVKDAIRRIEKQVAVLVEQEPSKTVTTVNIVPGGKT